jgi:hypothetical protein
MARSKTAVSKHYLQIAIGIFWLAFLAFVLTGGCERWIGGRVPVEEGQTGDEENSGGQIGTTSEAATLGAKPTNRTDAGRLGVSASTASSSAPINDGLTAESILGESIAQYIAATSYTDDAKLYLTYRLHGKPIKEQQRWSTHWDRNNRWWAQLFDAQIQCDGKLLSCYVYDISSQNLDNQQLIVPVNNGIPVDSIYNDSIANHFVQGFSKLPLTRSALKDSTALAPLPIALLSQKIRSPWITNESQLQRLADDTVNGRDCYVVRTSSASYGPAEIWIDKQSKTILQMNLPTSVLDGAVLNSDAVTDLRFFAVFENAKLNGMPSPKFTAVNVKKNASLVRQFVKVPDSLSTELLGEVAPTFDLLDEYAAPVRSKSFADKTTTLLWLAGKSPLTALEELSKVKSAMGESFRFAAIVSNESVEQSADGKMKISQSIVDAARKAGVPIYFDPNLAATKLLRVDLVPTSQGPAVEKPIVLVTDKDMRIQYARTIPDEDKQIWPVKLAESLKLVNAGQDVATDIRRQYKSYLDGYNRDLEKVSAVSLFPDLKSSVAAKTSVPVRRVVDSSIKLTPNLQWSSGAFQKPGNVLVGSASVADSLFVLDGWQTIKELSTTGEVLRTHRLELAEKEAVSCVRGGRMPNGDSVFAAFSKLGRQVHFYDSSWKLVGSFPTADVKHQGIQDVQAYDPSGSGSDQFLVCFNDEHGGHLIDPTTGKSSPVTSQVIGAAAPSGKRVAILDRGKLGWVKERPLPSDEEFSRLASVGAGVSSRFGATGINKEGTWSLAGFDETLKKIWNVPIGSQFFTDETESLAVTRSANNTTLWAVADTANVVTLISGDGKWLGDFDASAKIHGIGLVSIQNRISLVVSSAKGVECWALNFDSNRFRRASTGGQ